jgi:hypothetical protein
MQKGKILDVIEKMPDEVDVDALLKRLYVLGKLEIAEKQFAEGKVISQEEIEREFNACQG